MPVVMMQQRLVKDFYKILNQVKNEEIPDGVKLPASFNHLVSEMKNNQYDARTFAFMLRAMVCVKLFKHGHNYFQIWFISLFLISWRRAGLTNMY
jgi:hypothetical protein